MGVVEAGAEAAAGNAFQVVRPPPEPGGVVLTVAVHLAQPKKSTARELAFLCDFRHML
jgi:hypothetical protein